LNRRTASTAWSGPLWVKTGITESPGNFVASIKQLVDLGKLIVANVNHANKDHSSVEPLSKTQATTCGINQLAPRRIIPQS
jgi:flavorubredoxin